MRQARPAASAAGRVRDLLRGDEQPLGIRVTGSSMGPFLRDGDVAQVVSASRGEVRLGDLVVFQSGARPEPVIHRVVGRRGDNLMCRGDSAMAADPLVSPQELLGRVISIQRRGAVVCIGPRPVRLLAACLTRAGLLRILNVLVAGSAWGLRAIFRPESGRAHPRNSDVI